MNKYVKYISLGIFVAIPIGFIVGFSRAWNSPPSITAAGSTAVQPLLAALGNYYDKADVTVQPGGSSLGMKVAADGSKSLGNASKNTYSSVGKATMEKNGFTWETWRDNGLKTITVAWDGIAIVYKPDSQDDPVLQINQDNILMIYESFAGIKNYRLYDLFVNQIDVNNKKNNLLNYQNPINSSFIKPYARTGGGNASGTATSFAKESGFNYSSKDEQRWKEAQDILLSGNYGSNVSTTNESNVESWNRFNIENKPGSMIYLSLGFVSTNREFIESQGYKIANYYNPIYSPNNVPVIADTKNVTNKTYGWYSPLNTIIATNLANNLVKQFIWWLYTDEYVNRSDTDNPGLIQKIGYAPLSDEDKLKMFYLQNETIIDNQINTSNYKSYEDVFFHVTDIQKGSTTWEKSNQWYGVPK
ncbi:PstS family phosphate ABC transporter substrate-binding protein [Malacoplasma muris]|uniref:PstS family phosphate ABC transporter substrate-binding protein n=1 Tax=Malacoplasma muris TaxID=2119 RepID=UPI00398F4AE6